MLALVEFKEKLKNLYADHELFLKPMFKFLAVFISLVLIKYNVGYMSALNMWVIVLGISALFAFLPMGIDIVGLGVIIALNVFSLSTELGLILTFVIFVMLIFFFRFTPKQGMFLVIIPLAFFLKIPFIIPIAAALVYTPMSIVSVACGTIIYYILDIVRMNELTIRNITNDQSEESIGNVITLIGNNTEMVLTIVSFAVTITVVYLIKRTSINNSWAIAIVTGAIIDFVLIMVGGMLFNTKTSMVWLIIGTLISLGLAYGLQFFVFSVDYSRTEHTQFEDDEYYYYVKAVPKINVTAPAMNVKRINAQRQRKKSAKNKQ